MRKRFKYILLLSAFILLSGLWALNADYLAPSQFLPEFEIAESMLQPQVRDSIPPTRYPVSKTTTEEYEDLLKHSPADLKDPENVTTTIEYDINTGTYIVKTKLGDMELGTPMTLTPEEYQIIVCKSPCALISGPRTQKSLRKKRIRNSTLQICSSIWDRPNGYSVPAECG